MANHYSEHFAVVSSSTVAPATAYADPPIKAAPGRGMARVYRKTAHMDFSSIASGGIVDADVARVFSLKSGDRITALLFQADTGFVDTGTLTIDIGLHAVNDTHSGAVLDVNLFAALVNLDATASEDVDAFLESGTLDGLDRGKALWELLALGAGSDTSDPFVEYDVTITFNSGTAVTAGGTLALQVEFIAAGVN